MTTSSGSGSASSWRDWLTSGLAYDDIVDYNFDDILLNGDDFDSFEDDEFTPMPSPAPSPAPEGVECKGECHCTNGLPARSLSVLPWHFPPLVISSGVVVPAPDTARTLCLY